ALTMKIGAAPARQSGDRAGDNRYQGATRGQNQYAGQPAGQGGGALGTSAMASAFAKLKR
ncbi:MAG: hypothetical protein K9K35_10590, partial [Rhodoferax sp.]|nr:hypothetical protein [Rhodoferax sp.]